MNQAHAPLPDSTGLSSSLTRFCVAVLLAFGAAEVQAANATAFDGDATTHDTFEQDDPKTARRSAPAQAVEFNSDFLSPQAASTDVSRFEKGNPVLPGSYRVDLYLNGRALGRTGVDVKAGTDPQRGRVCMTRMLLDQIGLDWSKVDAQRLHAFDAADHCVELAELVDDAHADLDTGELRLDLSVPQAVLRRTPRGYVSPELWDAGVTAGVLGYTFNAYRTDASGAASNSAYLGVNAGFNLGKWHFRHDGAMNWQSRSGSQYQNINSYVERDLPSITSRLTLGDGNTTGELFDTLPFRGAQLATDDRMLPDSQRGYAPIIRGIAETNARVTVRQRGSVIYDTPVSPGPFIIDDLYPTGYGGDLEVTVTEADGRVRKFAVPYASVAQLLRPGISRFSVTTGLIRNESLSFKPKLLQATYQRGLTNHLTGYGGVQANEYYAAVLTGVAVGTPLGALSLDVTGARTRLPNESQAGISVRVGYSKLFEETRSNVSVAAYRFSTSGFMDIANAMQTTDAVREGMSSDAISRPRNRLSITFNQALGDRWGQLFVSGFTQDYWNANRKDVQFQGGYSNQYKSLAYTLSANRVRNAYGQMDNQFMANLSIPLGKSTRAPQFGVNVTTQPGAGTTTQTTLGGVAGADNQWSYGASVSNGPAGSGTAGTVNGQYRGAKTTAQAGFALGRGYNSTSVGLSGSVVAHPDGITLSPYSGDTVAVVAAPDAAGARILGYAGLSLDGRGYGVVPYLTPYRLNEVAIDPKGLSADVELKTTSQLVAPRAGSVVMMRYDTVKGRAVLIDATRADGEALPFGADVVDADGNSVGAVGQAGRIFARLAADNATLAVRWGLANDQQCTMRVALPEIADRKNKGNDIERVQLPCVSHPDAAQR
ncbi:fimbria/pilus outer membrane usher protein [Burkholderia sp. Z1]|uniref:fimbria/pilus outer membrane usher protein n=1 Tax=Burkholderia sp. Z1 TaxID=2759039 RepID=UPI0018687AA0|nr:fimbria/pilus outer membrane usher protein [Burkholderia sp. Z1]